jgi:hypothetical protein
MSLVEQGVGHVVVARRKAHGAASLAERNERRRLKHALRRAFILRTEKTSGAYLQIPVSRPWVPAFFGSNGSSCKKKSLRRKKNNMNAHLYSEE